MIYWLKKISIIVIAIAIISIGINWFLAPHHIAAGGLTGLAIIIEEASGIGRSSVVFFCNLFVLLLTFLFLGKETFWNTVVGAMLLPVFIGIIPDVTFTDNTMLSVIFGSVLFGMGVSLLYANKASSGGTTIPPLILKKYFNLNPSVGLFITDAIVVALNLIVFDTESFFFAIFSIFITTVTMNYIESGTNKKKVVYIISKEKDVILKDLLYEIKRGVTVIPVIGAYSKKRTDMLMVTLNSKNYSELISVVDKYDKTAFIIAYNVTDVHGLGFTYQSGSI